MANSPVQPSAQTAQLLQAAGQAAADDAAAGKQVVSDQANIVTLNQQLSAAQTTLATDQTAAQQADKANQSAFIAAVQGLAADFGVPLPITIQAPSVAAKSA